MATADQIKLLIHSHVEQDDERFKTIALQLAAYEAQFSIDTLDKIVEGLNISPGELFRTGKRMSRRKQLGSK
ncbi:hypothetical protein [Paenibacillus sp. 8b26]|uniref:hypothetical protein n=1 Tax=Paenibacillus sp. 8b26 TaxID=3424133 RepID=UPI003D66196F